MVKHNSTCKQNLQSYHLKYNVLESQQTNDPQYLQSLVCDGTISPTEALKMFMKMNHIKQLEEKYGAYIKQRRDGRQFYIRINQRQLTGTSHEALVEKLWDMEYGKQTSTLSDLYPKFMLWKRDYVSAHTLRYYKTLWSEYLLDVPISTIPIVQLKVKDYTNFFRLLTKDRTMPKKRFVNLKSLLNGIYDYAIAEDIVDRNPIRDVNCKQFTFQPVNNQYDVFSIEERNKLLSYLENDNCIYSLAIQLDFHLVVRIGELLALRWSDIKGDYIHIHCQHLSTITMNDDLTFSSRECKTVNHVKGYASSGLRSQPLTPKAKDILAKIKVQNPNSEFILMQNNKQLLTNMFNRNLKRYCYKVGVRPRSSHKIRFSSASILHQQGMPLPALQELLGHTTVAMTLHYLRSVSSKDATSELMQKALG